MNEMLVENNIFEELEERLIEELDERDEFGGCLIHWD